jgi:hypothetical protein
VCRRPAGIAPFTFIEEYLGELHVPWRWFEIQARAHYRRFTLPLRRPAKKCLN